MARQPERPRADQKNAKSLFCAAIFTAFCGKRPVSERLIKWPVTSANGALIRRAQLEESVARYLSQFDTGDLQEPSEALAAKTARLL